LSESSSTARRRHEYLPNRMFDPVANPFAVQNLLVKEEQVFALTPDERPEFGFESDPLISKEATGTFALDELIELADLSGGAAFASDTSAHDVFMPEPSPATAQATVQESDFIADASMTAQRNAVFTDTDAPGENVAAAEASEVDGPVVEAGEAAIAQAAALMAEITDSDASAIDEVDAASAEMPETDVPDLTSEPASESAPESATESATEANKESETASEAQPASAQEAPVVAGAAATPDLSGEAVTALVEAAREQARAEARELAYNEGLEAGMAEARAELQTEHDTQITQLKTLQEALRTLSFDADALFEPVKKLTVHLAEQLVRGELAQSPQTISRLVDNSLRELNASGEKAVIVHLNPEDLEAYRPLVAQFSDSMILRPDSLLERGSVRVSLDGSVVEDLMQRRVDGLKKSLNQPAAPGWQAGGSRLSDRLNESQRGSQPIEDVTAVETTGNDDVIND
jgi:flagellar biosynthesis/type III secretory pathway protein FliH